MAAAKPAPADVLREVPSTVVAWTQMIGAALAPQFESIHQRIDTLSQLIKERLNAQDKRIDRVERTQTDHEKRIRALERKKGK